MSLSEQTMLDLMAYADGELVGSAAKRIEKLVARDEEARNVLDAMQTLTECLHVVEAERPAPKFDVDGIVDTVMKEVSTLPIPVDEERPRKLLRGGVAGLFSAALAIAAGWMLFAPEFQPPTKQQIETAELIRQGIAAQKNPPKPPPEVVASADPEPKPVATEPGGVELDHVESPSHEVSVFYVPALAENLTESGENASTSVVVWIGDNQRGL